MQADQSEYETHFLVELAKTHPKLKGWSAGLICRIKMLKKDLQFFSQYTIIKGWRHIVQAEPDDFLLRPDFQSGIKPGSLINILMIY